LTFTKFHFTPIHLSPNWPLECTSQEKEWYLFQFWLLASILQLKASSQPAFKLLSPLPLALVKAWIYQLMDDLHFGSSCYLTSYLPKWGNLLFSCTFDHILTQCFEAFCLICQDLFLLLHLNWRNHYFELVKVALLSMIITLMVLFQWQATSAEILILFDLMNLLFILETFGYFNLMSFWRQ